MEAFLFLSCLFIGYVIFSAMSEESSRRERLREVEWKYPPNETHFVYFIWPVDGGFPEHGDNPWHPTNDNPWANAYWGDTAFHNGYVMFDWLGEWTGKGYDASSGKLPGTAEKLGLHCLRFDNRIDGFDARLGRRYWEEPNLWYAPDDYIAASEKLIDLINAGDPVTEKLFASILRTDYPGNPDPKVWSLALAEDIGHRARLCKERGHTAIGLAVECY